MKIDQDQDRALSGLGRHRFYDYRACAPHWDNPQMCAADDTVPWSVFSGPASEEEGEPQKARLAREEQAKALCAGCPLREACLEYAVGDGPKVRESRGVWGGTIPYERRVMLKARIGDVPEPVAGGEVQVALLRTDQKQTVLAALAANDDLEHAVEAAVGQAGMDERAVRWQMSRIATLLGLGKGQRDRDGILAAAELANVLPAAATAAPEEAPVAAPVVELESAETGGPIRLPYPRCTDIPGQLQLDVGDAARPRLRVVISPATPKRAARTVPVPLFAIDTGVPVLLEAA